jgi:hypothetical protein
VERDPTKMIRLKNFRETLEGRHTVVRFRESDDLAPAPQGLLSSDSPLIIRVWTSLHPWWLISSFGWIN